MPDGRSFRFAVDAALPPRQALERVLDVRLHGRLVPFTRGSGPAPDCVGVGDQLVARTAWCRIGFDDIMRVVEYEPGSHLVLHKVGAVLGGVVEVRCAPSAGGTRIEWNQTVDFPFLPRGVDRLVSRLAAPILRRGYRHFVGRLAVRDPR